jgi:2-iminobutanoate/2-iminopropanoate deaminase
MFAPILFCYCCSSGSSALAEKKSIRPPAGPTAGPYSAGVIAGKLLYVSGHVGPEPGGGFAPGNVKTQTRRCLELVGKVLTEAGLDYRHVVSTTLYLADIRTLDAADAAYREVFPQGAPYPARTEIESQLLIPEALSEVSAVAVLGDWRANIYLNPKGWAEPKRPLSHAVLAAGTLFFSALRPVNPATGALVGDTVGEQTAQAMRNQEAVLSSAGMKRADMAASRFYLSDARYEASFQKAYGKLAAAATATAIAAPVEPGHLVQIQSVAVKKPGPGGTVYLSGATGRSGGIKAQTRQALQSIEQQLARYGMTFADTADAVVWLREPRHAAAMNEVYREIVKPNPAARATVRLSPGAADALIEIMMIAHK